MLQLSREQMEKLLRYESISDVWPWSTDDLKIVNSFLHGIVVKVAKELGLDYLDEFASQGSMYTNYWNALFFRQDGRFRYASSGNYYYGLELFFSLYSPYFIMQQGEVSWKGEPRDSPSGLPEMESIDQYHRPEMEELAVPVREFICQNGMTNLSTADLSPFLPIDLTLENINGEPPWRYFDVLFIFAD